MDVSSELQVPAATASERAPLLFE